MAEEKARQELNRSLQELREQMIEEREQALEESRLVQTKINKNNRFQISN